MNHHSYENYTRPHMEDMRRKAEQRRLTEANTLPMRVQVGQIMVRTGRWLLNERPAKPQPITNPIPEVYYP
jgi:hypothetical protein